MNKKGFTLVELLVTIAISTLVLSLGTILVNEMIEKNKDKTVTIAKENIKKSASLYSKEFFDEIVWLNNQSCISIEQLISKGYISKDKAEKTGFKYVIIEKDDNNTIISERNSEGNDEDSNLCGAIVHQKVAIPTSKDICEENLTYNGEIQKLTKNGIDSIYQISNEFSVKSDAGHYGVSVNLQNGYHWVDNSTEIRGETKTPETKTVSCTIQKGIPDLKLMNKDMTDEIYGQDGEQTIPIEVTVTSDVPGTIELKSSNNKYATVELSESNGTDGYLLEYREDINKINKYVKIITIKNHANRKTNTYITIKHHPTNPNYQSTATTYTIGKITDIKREKPTAVYCTNPYYNNTEQTITTEEIGYTFTNNKQTEVGTYTVTASLHPGFIWEDGSTNDETFDCEIKPLTYKIKYNGNGNTSGSMSQSDHTYGVLKKLTANGFTKTGYTFIGWATSPTGTVIYENAAPVENLITPETDANGTIVNLYAQWRINKVYIKYSTNGGNITSPTTENGVTSTWTKGENDIIYQATSSQPSTSTFYVYDYGSSTTDAGLANWNNPSYINISRTGYGAKSGEQWICLSGNCTKNKTYNHGSVYAASDFCNASNGDCTAVLGVNWIDNVAPTTPTYRAFYDNGSGNYTSGNWTTKKVNTTISSSDEGSGIVSIQYSSNKTSWTTLSLSEGALTKSGTTWSGTEPWNLYNRNHTYYFRACDNSGNCSGASSAFNIKYDITAPTCGITKSGDSNGVDATIKCNDNSGGIGCDTGTQYGSNLKSSKTFSVKDKLGNSRTCTVSVTSSTSTYWRAKCNYYERGAGLLYVHTDKSGLTSEDKCKATCSSIQVTTGYIVADCSKYTVTTYK